MFDGRLQCLKDPDNIPPEALKVDVNSSADMFYSIFGRIWEEEKTPTEWAEGHCFKKVTLENVTTTEGSP